MAYKWWACDFETAADPQAEQKEITYVWAWGLANISKDVKELDYYGTNIETFMETAFKLGGTFWFHNEKFDGSFILNWLFKYKYIYSDKNVFDMPNKTFNVLCNNMGQIYRIVIKNNDTAIKIQNSLLKIPSSIKQMAKDLKLEVSKGDIDYKKYRPENCELTEEEYEYLERDVVILAKSMYELHMKNNNSKLTIGADCINSFKKFCKNYDKLFPQINEEEDKFIRQSYFGGYVYVKPEMQNKILDWGSTYDKNSMYPGVMHSSSGYLFPYGSPVYFEGEYEFNGAYPLYVQHVVISHAVLKPNRWPTINLKRKFNAHSEYATELEDEDLVLTSVDLKWLEKNYDIEHIEYIDGYMFKATIGKFDDYINFYNDLKVKATLSKNAVERYLAKLMLNNLYGKFATNPVHISKIPVWDKEKRKIIWMYDKDYWDLRKQIIGDEPTKEIREYRPTGYIPVATFITAYARNELFNALEVLWDYFCYCDTDSVHILYDGIKIAEKLLDIHPSKLGAWKQESRWNNAMFIRPKTYIEHEVIKDGKFNLKKNVWNIKACGMPDNIKSKLKIEDFNIGTMWVSDKYLDTLPDKKKEKLYKDYKIVIVPEGKLVPKQVDGGVILVERPFSIND